MRLSISRGTHRLALFASHSIVTAFVLSLVLPMNVWALRLPDEKPGPRAQVYALWNPDYLCLSAKVPDIMLTGSSVGAMSAPQQDDAIEFDIEVATPAGRDAHRLIISAAGGMTVLVRDASGRWRPDPSWISGTQTLKYAVTADGTLNNPSDKDVGYTVECAIPWKFLGGEAPVDKEIGFNAICWMQGDSEGPVSWAQTVTSEQDAGDPSRWGRMLVTPSSALVVAEGAWLPCPYGRIPFVDGKLTAEEWMTASTLAFDLPEAHLTPVATQAKQTDVVGTLLAIYRYDWQGDPSRPGAHLWQPTGGPATSDQPREAAGPWYSWERVAWHRSQLDEAQRAGIDIILAKYDGDDESRHTWARTGLDRLSEALKTMRAEGRSYPLVGMMLDTAPLAGVDLKSDQGKRLLYGMIRDFFLHVPREFWAELGLRPGQSNGGVPVLLGEPDGLGDWDGSFVTYAQQSFSRDFDGEKLAWLGSSQWRVRGADGFYSYVRLPITTGLSQDGAGGTSAMAISPGFCPPPGTVADIRPRRDGRAYRSDWQRVLATMPELVVLSSWNDFADGTELAPSRQYGFAYVDMTRYFAARMGSKQPHSIRLKKRDVPDVLLPGADYRVEFLVENVGTEDLRTGRRISADYRIVRRSDGKVMLSKTGAQDLSIMAGQTLRLPVVITTKDDHGSPLPPGEYLFSLVVMRSKVAYLRSEFLAKPAAELTVPITVGTLPPRRFTVVSTSLPSTVESGGTEQVVVRVRNDGATTWRASAAALSYRWLRHEDTFAPSEGDAALGEGGRASLPQDVPPGEIVSVMIPVVATQSDGSALVPPQAGDLWHYRVQWNLVDADGRYPSEGVWAEAIAVIASDRGVHFDSAAAPSTMQAGEQAKVAVTVGNSGQRPWSSADSYLTYRWHRWDGREIVQQGARTPLPYDMASGRKVKLAATVTAPSAEGPYWLAWDLVTNGVSCTAAGGGRRPDLLVSPVMVRGGAFKTLDLTSLANMVAITDDAHRSRGDMDGQGRSLPAEWLPPDQTGAADGIYPTAYYAPLVGTEGVPFLFPDTSTGVAGAVACDGQAIPLGDKGVTRVHLLLANTGEDREIGFGLQLADGALQQVTVSAPAWRSAAPSGTEDIGLSCPYLRTMTNDDGTAPGVLYHRVVSSSTGRAVSLALPKEPSVKILAVTVEGE